MNRRSALLLFAVCCVAAAKAQEQTYVNGTDTLHYVYAPLPVSHEASDSVRLGRPKRRNIFRRIVDYFDSSTVDRTFEKKIDFTCAGGPSYSKNTSLGIGVLASGLYRVDRTDSVTPPSDISIFANVSVTGVYSVGISGNTILDRNRRRIDYTLMFSSTPRDIWGIGYDDGRWNAAGDYIEKHYLVQGRYLQQLLPHFYIGGMLSFDHTQGKRFDRLAESYLYGQKPGYTATGIGALLEFDTLDFIPNPYKGIYVSFQETFFAKGLGNVGQSLWRTTVIVDGYRQLWKGGVLAADLYAEFNSNGTPWPLLARMGGSYRMRGYYQGRYTDNDMITLQVELRQRIWRRIGCTVWAGAGNVFPELARFDWSQTLPNYGVGLRWELKKRVNVRIDYGFGRKTSGFLLNVNEAF